MVIQITPPPLVCVDGGGDDVRACSIQWGRPIITAPKPIILLRFELTM
ncbi:hypothetical protein BDA96_08G028700 [Sorghum bicolor]|uniref:Uncharacterized protein n=1 Tax=Sorghum bicolor TaxID=4558 RepID=A0A921U718_SORBI|nr:hypothetical protein BDA96_08G028700 [Sorghum bicolor]